MVLYQCWAPTDLGVHLSVSHLFAFSCRSWGFQGKNTEVVCHSLLQWIAFCQTSPPRPVCLGWPHIAWLSFIELDKAVVHVIRLANFLLLWFQCVCPLMPSESAALNMTANLENSAVATGLEKVNFHSNTKERKCQRMFKLPHNCNHLTRCCCC